MDDIHIPGIEDELKPAVSRLDKDLRRAAKEMGKAEARFLVDTYYAMQEARKRSANQVRAMKADEEPKATEGEMQAEEILEVKPDDETGKKKKKKKKEEPHSLIEWYAAQNKFMEDQIKVGLDLYSLNHPVGEYMRSVKGIGPVIAAGLLAYIDIDRAPTVGHIWRIAGLDPTISWLGREKASKIVTDVVGKSKKITPEMVAELAVRTGRRADKITLVADDGGAVALRKYLALRPWSQSFKTLCWKAGDSFCKFSTGENPSYYGVLYRQRKAWEIQKNESGGNAAAAARYLKEKNFGKETAAFKAYTDGKLPDGQIDARARRWAVKIFLAHVHQFWYEHHHGKPAPNPYPIEHLGHTHMIEPRPYPLPDNMMTNPKAA